MKAKENQISIEEMIENKRLDLLGKQIPLLKKRDLKKKDKEEDWTKILEYLLDHQQKTLSCHLLERGILGILAEERRTRVYRKILRYKDEQMFRHILKYEKEISERIFPFPESKMEKLFLKVILNKYRKSIELEEERKRLWELCFACEADKMMGWILRKKKDFQYLGRIAGNSSDEIFQALDCIPAKSVLLDVRKEVLAEAFLTQYGKDRLDYLEKRGWMKGERRKERISILEKTREKLGRRKYEKSRRGQQEKTADEKKLKYLIRCEAEGGRS